MNAATAACSERGTDMGRKEQSKALERFIVCAEALEDLNPDGVRELRIAARSLIEAHQEGFDIDTEVAALDAALSILESSK